MTTADQLGIRHEMRNDTASVSFWIKALENEPSCSRR